MVSTCVKLYKCEFPKCGKTFSHKNSLNRHKNLHSELKSFRCKICSFRCATESNCKRHEATHDQNRKRLKCNRCHSMFLTTNNLRRHVRTDHLNIQPKAQFECIFCGKKYLGKGDFEKHLLSHIQEKPHFCGHCHSEFSQKSTLSRHMIARHPDNVLRGILKFRCELCSKEFLFKDSLQSHIQRHLGEKPYRCTECPKAFVSKRDLQLHHDKKHSERKRLICNVCGKGYLDKRSFHNHEQTHDPSWRRYKCGGCPQQFDLKEDLNSHIINSEHSELHQDRRCIFCQKFFTKPNLLWMHLQVNHLREKPHFCDQCDKEFSRKPELRSHKQTHDPNRQKQFKCERCKKRYFTRSHLARHLRSHCRKER